MGPRPRSLPRSYSYTRTPPRYCISPRARPCIFLALFCQLYLLVLPFFSAWFLLFFFFLPTSLGRASLSFSIFFISSSYYTLAVWRPFWSADAGSLNYTLPRCDASLTRARARAWLSVLSPPKITPAHQVHTYTTLQFCFCPRLLRADSRGVLSFTALQRARFLAVFFPREVVHVRESRITYCLGWLYYAVGTNSFAGFINNALDGVRCLERVCLLDFEWVNYRFLLRDSIFKYKSDFLLTGAYVIRACVCARARRQRSKLVLAKRTCTSCKLLSFRYELFISVSPFFIYKIEMCVFESYNTR